MIQRISKNILLGEFLTLEDFVALYRKGGESVYHIGWKSTKPVAFIANMNWSLLNRIIESRVLFKTYRVNELIWPSYNELIDFMRKNNDMFEKLKFETVFKYKMNQEGIPTLRYLKLSELILVGVINPVKIVGKHI